MIGLLLFWLGLAVSFPLPDNNARADSVVPANPTNLAALLRTRKVSPVALTRSYIDRLKNDSSASRFMVLVTESLAVEQAARAEKELQGGRLRSPLHGVPYAMEYVLSARGAGLEGPPGSEIPPGDLTVLRRLAEAGAVFVGWVARGKSSAAVSAGVVPFVIGSNGWGPVASPPFRGPVTALLPTQGRVSLAGCTGLRWNTSVRLGPVSHSAAECAMILRLISGPDGIDHGLVRDPFPAPARKASRSLALATAGAGPALLRKLQSVGAKSVPVELPATSGEFRQIMARYDILLISVSEENPLALISSPCPTVIAGGLRGSDRSSSLILTGRMFEEERILDLLELLQRDNPPQRPIRRIPVPEAE